MLFSGCHDSQMTSTSFYVSTETFFSTHNSSSLFLLKFNTNVVDRSEGKCIAFPCTRNMSKSDINLHVCVHSTLLLVFTQYDLNRPFARVKHCPDMGFVRRSQQYHTLAVSLFLFGQQTYSLWTLLLVLAALRLNAMIISSLRDILCLLAQAISLRL